MRPSEYIRAHTTTNRMEKYEIDDRIIVTNLGAINLPYWNGNGNGYSKISMTESMDEVFDKLIEQGYVRIRFVLLSTSIRGYTNVYYSAKK